MKTKLREQAVKLRTEQELSYSAIKIKLGVPKSTLSYWLKDFSLSEKKILELRKSGWSKGEVGRERYRNKMKAKRELGDRESYEIYKRKFTKLNSQTIFIAGLMLYLAEGEKTSNHRIMLSNTDSRIINFFIQWLQKFFDVSRDNVRITLHLYENMNIGKEEKYWEGELGLTKVQFYKTQIRKLQKGSFTYSNSSFRHGTCSVYYGSAEKKRSIQMGIKASLENLTESLKGV